MRRSTTPTRRSNPFAVPFELNPNSAESLASMGQLLRKLARYGEAIKCLD